MTVSIGVVGHHTRRLRAERLAECVDAEVISIDEEHARLGAGGNHEVVWEWLAGTDSEWGLLLEDDAIPTKNHFLSQLDQVLKVSPTPVVSLYLGRSRPPHWQPMISQVIAREENFLIANELLHHVAVAIRTELIAPMLEDIRKSRYRGVLPIDEAIGAWMRGSGISVSYTNPSIVDHEHRLPTVITKHISQHKADNGKRPKLESRKAWVFGDRNIWNSSAAHIPNPIV